MNNPAINRIVVGLTFALLGGVPAAAGDYFHSCADASGDLIITDGVLRQPRHGTNPGDRPEIKFTETGRITIHRKEGQCFSKSCGRSFDHELESYLLFAEFEYDGLSYQATFVCERAVSALPAACECDDESITYQRDLKPAFTETGKPRKTE